MSSHVPSVLLVPSLRAMESCWIQEGSRLLIRVAQCTGHVGLVKVMKWGVVCVILHTMECITLRGNGSHRQVLGLLRHAESVACSSFHAMFCSCCYPGIEQGGVIWALCHSPPDVCHSATYGSWISPPSPDPWGSIWANFPLLPVPSIPPISTGRTVLPITPISAPQVSSAVPMPFGLLAPQHGHEEHKED